MKKKKRRFRIKYIFIIGLIIYLSTIFIKQEVEIKDLQSEIEAKNQEKEDLDIYIEENSDKATYLERISEAEDPVEYIKSLDSEEQKKEYSSILEYIENIARGELFMVKPNEIIYIDRNKLNNIFGDDN